jgi:hypothetical protein
MSSTFHPQSDGQSKATNKILTMYLRCLTGDRPRQWFRWLPWVEFYYNSSFQASLHTSSFRVVYGHEPPLVRMYAGDETRLLAVHQQLLERDEFLEEIRDRLEQAQHHQKLFFDRKHHAVEFHVGQWVWLRLLQRPIVSLDNKGRDKLGPKFYGLFQISECVGDVAYKLLLPAGTKLHNVFHVRLLKKYCGQEPTGPRILPPIRHGRACAEPVKVARSRTARGHLELLVHWKGLSAPDATWVPLQEFKELYPSFQLEDELILQRERCHGGHSI